MGRPLELARDHVGLRLPPRLLTRLTDVMIAVSLICSLSGFLIRLCYTIGAPRWTLNVSREIAVIFCGHRGTGNMPD